MRFTRAEVFAAYVAQAELVVTLAHAGIGGWRFEAECEALALLDAERRSCAGTLSDVDCYWNRADLRLGLVERARRDSAPRVRDLGGDDAAGVGQDADAYAVHA
jgi:hypothetical protein